MVSLDWGSQKELFPFSGFFPITLPCSNTSTRTPSPSVTTASGSEEDLGYSSQEDSDMLDGSYDLPLRLHFPGRENDLRVQLHPLPTNDSFLVSVQTPKVPAGGLKRASCDIVLVIDVSGSMSDPAPLPDVQDQNEKEATGLSILDLTKHAAKTILETLNKSDRLGIVTFSDDAKVGSSPCSRSMLYQH